MHSPCRWFNYSLKWAKHIGGVMARNENFLMLINIEETPTNTHAYTVN